MKSLNASSARPAASLTQADFERIITLPDSNLQRAENEAARLCRLHRRQPGLENLHGVILSRMGTFEDAAQAFRRALDIEPRFMDALNNLASTLSELSHDQEALQYYEQLVAINRRDPEIFYNYGNTLRKLDRNRDAINTYKNALNLRPLYVEAYNNMGNALIELGDQAQARTCYENALEIDPNHDRAIRNLAQAYEAELRYGAAEALFQRVLSRKPGDVSALQHLVTCLLVLKKQSEAIETLEKLLQLTPTASVPQFLLDALRGKSRDRQPVEYTRRLFDGYADRFERELPVTLGYRTPTVLRELLSEAAPTARQYSNALDIGCGTGLVGEAFQTVTSRLTGIDLSSAMLAKARDQDLYDNLLHGNAVELIGASEDSFDLVLCADALPYIGDLAPLFTAVAARTAAGGHFLCSTEQAECDTYLLQTSTRFAHSTQYVIECASVAGLDILTHDTVQLRKERGE